MYLCEPNVMCLLFQQLSLVIESVHSWLLEPVSPTTDHDDHWLVRDYAARVLAHIVR